ncbi:HNH endonuclease [Streptomyces sp. or20]|uniref:HNH endonuclease n=1 Tax=Streptomyces sp. or20 TaxID=1828016 RepID=UPI00211D4A20|nr:HNH endonuclease [Streptomyces sp. or20]
MRDAKRYNRSIHRLVLRAFADAPGDSGIVGAHLNGDPRDNRLANLRWVSQSENLSHRKEHGTELLGERNGRAKLTEDDVRTIRKLADLGRTCASLADEYDVRYGTVNKVITRESWRHVA